MPPKKGRKKGKGADKEKKTITQPKAVVLCGVISPGPIYQLKTLVGHKNHCISKFQNPAYTFGGPYPLAVDKGPGPEYEFKERKREGFTFGIAAKHREILGPGPYKLPDVPRGPFFSIKWRTSPRKISPTPGPYYIKPDVRRPAFTMGLRKMEKIMATPGPYTYSVNPIKPRPPMYTITLKKPTQYVSHSPGPIYAIKPSVPQPAYSFGVKHSECAPPYITECDDKC